MTITTLKLLGICSMVWDHFSCIFPLPLLLPGLRPPFSHLLPYFGRLAAPIFLYTLVSGFRHTGSRKRYAGRLLAFAALSQPPYWLFFCGEARRYGQPLPSFGETGCNILFTLFLGLVMLELVERLRYSNPAAAALAAAACMLLARALDLEGREGYLLILLTLYFLTDGKKRPRWLELLLLLLAAVLGRWRLLLLAAEAGMRSTVLLNTLGPFLGLALAFFACSGKKGSCSRRLQWGMYLFYPLHLLALGLAGLMLPPM